MGRCLISLQEVPDRTAADPAAVRGLFGIDDLPTVEIELAKLHTFGLAMVGRRTLSGVQRKISLGLEIDRATLQVAVAGRQYVLKPPSEAFPELPQNEHLTMHLARLCGVEVPPFGLIPMADGTLAYIIRRFDRPDGGGKLRQEDFCQLAGKMPAEKYDGSCELCARLVLRFASEPLIEVRRLFRRVLFCWWTGNGDMHLKNYSLLADAAGRHALSPAYDLLCTRLYIPADRLALPLGGRDRGLTARHWRDFAAYCRLTPRAAARVAAELFAAKDDLLELVRQSFLSSDLQEAYATVLETHAPVVGELARDVARRR
jgi:serine/threonine-protein kinase HipA